MNMEGEIRGLQSQIHKLKNDVDAIKKLAVSQAAMMALLCAMLAGKGHLTKQEAILVACAGQDTQQYEGLTPQEVQDWIKNHLRSL